MGHGREIEIVNNTPEIQLYDIYRNRNRSSISSHHTPPQDRPQADQHQSPSDSMDDMDDTDTNIQQHPQLNTHTQNLSMYTNIHDPEVEEEEEDIDIDDLSPLVEHSPYSIQGIMNILSPMHYTTLPSTTTTNTNNTPLTPYNQSWLSKHLPRRHNDSKAIASYQPQPMTSVDSKMHIRRRAQTITEPQMYTHHVNKISKPKTFSIRAPPLSPPLHGQIPQDQDNLNRNSNSTSSTQQAQAHDIITTEYISI